MGPSRRSDRLPAPPCAPSVPQRIAALTFVIRKRPPIWRPSPIKAFIKGLCDTKSRTAALPPIRHEADAAEAKDHHRPSRGFGDGTCYRRPLERDTVDKCVIVATIIGCSLNKLIAVLPEVAT
jgi:hypothetical protein